MASSHHERLHSNGEWSNIQSDMSHKHSAEWKKPPRKITYIWFHLIRFSGHKFYLQCWKSGQWLSWGDERRQEWGMRILFLELGVGYCFSFRIKLLQTWWRNPTQIYSLSSGSQKSEIKMSAGPGSLWRLFGAICSLPLLAPGDSAVPCGCIFQISISITTWSSLPRPLLLFCLL